VLRYLYAYRFIVEGFVANPNLGLAPSLPTIPGQPAPRHALRILGYFSAETLGIHPIRLPTNRGNGYVPPTVLPMDGRPRGYAQEISAGALPSFDCKNTDYTPTSQDPDEDEHRYKDGGTPEVDYDWAGCIITKGFGRALGGGRGPQVRPER
jgi:hypothetical protein